MGTVLLVVLFLLMGLFAASVYYSFRKRNHSAEEDYE